MRQNKLIRDLISETSIRIEKLIMPIFVKDGISEPEEVNSMPGQYRWPLNDKLIKFIEELIQYGIRSIILFGIPKHKDSLGSEAYSKDGIVQRSIKMIKEVFPELIVISDVCLCQYTDHGHCGIIKYVNGRYVIDNDETIKLYAKIALSHAEAGVDIVAPSGMMDGQVKAIREVLDKEGYEHVLIMSYSVKYASSFYGPFREAAYSSPKFGDRKSHQMDYRNAFEALKEVITDVNEGADIIMVKPALAYLDIIKMIKTHISYIPLAAFSVSGEYSMIKAASRMGWIDEKSIVFEIITSIFRAGADLIITYYALDVAKWIIEK